MQKLEERNNARCLRRLVSQRYHNVHNYYYYYWPTVQPDENAKKKMRQQHQNI